MLTDRDGWWSVPASTFWICPECKQPSDPADWEEVEAGCDDCGSHEGRQCPICGEVIDHVWGSREMAEALRKRANQEST